jgi:parallel beta-helix repeat protein
MIGDKKQNNMLERLVVQTILPPTTIGGCIMLAQLSLRHRAPDGETSQRYRALSGLAAMMLFGILLMPRHGAARDVASEQVISGQDALLKALDSAQGGETIRLVGGDYGDLQLAPRTQVRIAFDSPVIITSDDPADPAVFLGLDLRETSNLVFDKVMFDYQSVSSAPTHVRQFKIISSSNITIRNSVFDGDVARNVSPLADGFATGFGLSISGSDRVTIENNQIRSFFRGIVVGGSRNLSIRGNDLHDMRMDGMNFTSVQDVAITDNFIHDFRRSRDPKDHADMIQFWTKGTDLPSTGIVIQGNVLMAGNGNPTQSIFMRNEEVDQGRAGHEMFYRDVTIQDNVIINGHLHGITLGESENVIVRRNTLIRMAAMARDENLSKAVRIPRISVAEASSHVTVEGNLAAAFPAPRPGWLVDNNLVVQDVTALRTGFYHQIFRNAQLGDQTDLDNFSVLPGSAADQEGLGATLLRPGADRSRYKRRRRRTARHGNATLTTETAAQ